MAKKAASPKTAKANESKSRNDGNSKDKEAKDDSSPAKGAGTADDDKKTRQDSNSEDHDTSRSPGKDNRKRKAEMIGEDEGNEASNNDGAEGEATPNDDNEEDGKPAAAASLDIDLTKPIRRARTPYFIFSDENRAAIQAKVGFCKYRRKIKR